MNYKKTLNILNGQAMYNAFKNKYYSLNNVYVPFNEAMCTGEAVEDIFSDKFNRCRCDAHHITIEQYNETTLKPLEVLFENKFSDVVLWFDDDMFCQINLLTMLAYLESTHYKKKVIFNLVSRDFDIVNSFELDLCGYYEIYKRVMINKCTPDNVSLSVLGNGIRLYLDYIKDENEIASYIRQNGNLHRDILLAELLKRFQRYGLGDTQYIQLIESCRSHN